MPNQRKQSRRDRRDPVAIVGMGCRFAGIDSIESFWHVILNGIETVCEYPGGRFGLLDKLYAGSQVATRRGGFLSNLDLFDSDFFEISAREAKMLDPQQRLLLEVSWEALEDAGIPLQNARSSRTGVFVGLWTSDYEEWARTAAPENLLATTGTGRYAAAGRIGYFFDLRGPALCIDTACSSSLVAIHLACTSLRNGETEMALAGGANAILHPAITLAYSASGMLSPDGRSKFGDAAANGYVRSEGAGILVLKTLKRARMDGDRIHALILGGAINNDGHASGQLVSPSREAQEMLLRSAAVDAGIETEDIDYIEAHGAGTRVGDPVEIEAIGRVLASQRRRGFCALGSVKTNIGHTESAAGVAGVIKTALALEHGILPPSLHFKIPNPAIAWDQLPVRIQTEAAAWPEDSASRVAGINGFGITGTNAHLILQAAAAPPPVEPSNATQLFLLSAHKPQALRAMAMSWRDRLEGDAHWPDSMADLAFTAAARRTHHDFRLAITARDRDELKDRLNLWIGGEASADCIGGRRSYIARRVAFVFPGQGGQWIGMGRSLLREQRVFREALDECDRAVRKYTGWSVRERLNSREGDDAFSQVEVVQPVLFSVMVALAALWRSWGLEPSAVVGHSMGEAAAAAVCGALSIEDAAAVICHRSSLMKSVSGLGSMAVVQVGLEEATELIKGANGRLSVAACNSSTSIVLSGETHLLERVLSELEARDVFFRRIKVDVASHSAQMDSLAEDLAFRLEEIRPRTCSIPFYSTTTGRMEEGSSLNAGYWSRNLRLPVLFCDAVQRMLGDGIETFLEINAHPVLTHAIEENGRDAGKEILVAASLDRDREERMTLLNAAGLLLANGVSVDMGRLYPAGRCLSLPGYPWQRERHWLDIDLDIGTKAQVPQNAAVEAESCLDHIYQLRWIPRPALDLAALPERKCWILIGEGNIARRIAARVKSRGDECVPLAGPELLPKTLESIGTRCRGVIHVSAENRREEPVEQTWRTVRVVQALASSLLNRLPRLWLITCGSFALPDDASVSLAGACDWGLARVVACEYPELHCVNVDLGLTPSEEDFVTLADLLREDPQEDQIAVRGSRCFVARFEPRTDVRATAPAPIRSDATYLITGGLGGIGLELAHWLTQRGARHLALLGRREPSERARARIAAMEAAGATVRVYRADVSDSLQLGAALADAGSDMPPFCGVFHLSGIMDSSLLKDLNEAQLRSVLLPKAGGAWNLHVALERTPLDFFILFSSLTAAHSQAGLCSYSCANSFLDALARYRQARGLPALSIQWCVWTSLGLAEDSRVERGAAEYRSQGIRSVSAEVALHGLERMMATQSDVLLLMPARWTQFTQSLNGSIPTAFSRLVKPTAPDTVDRVQPPILELLVETPTGRPRRNLLESHVQRAVAHVLKMPESRVDRLKPLGTMGLTSLMAIELARSLSTTAAVRLPATAIFNYPSVALLAEEVARRMAIALDGGKVVEAAAVSSCSEGPAEAEISDEAAIEALMERNRGTP